MASLPDHCLKLIDSILREVAPRGDTTAERVTALTMSRLDRGQLPESLVRLATRELVSRAVRSRMKRPLSDSVANGMRKNIPDLAEVVDRLPGWICIDESGGRHVATIFASAADWSANAEIKKRKAKQTQKASDVSFDMSIFVQRHGIRCLADLMDVDEAA